MIHIEQNKPPSPTINTMYITLSVLSPLPGIKINSLPEILENNWVVKYAYTELTNFTKELPIWYN